MYSNYGVVVACALSAFHSLGGFISAQYCIAAKAHCSCSGVKIEINTLHFHYSRMRTKTVQVSARLEIRANADHVSLLSLTEPKHSWHDAFQNENR